MGMQKKLKKEASCPMWMATYGDLVTNLLVFFVLMLSMSEVKKDEQFLDFMQAIREAFGYIGGVQELPTDATQKPNNTALAQMLVVPIEPEKMSKSPDPGIRHKHATVTDIRRGDKFALGGSLDFRELSAEMLPEDEARLVEYAEKLRGHSAQIEVRGHCSRRPVDGTEFADHYDLSFARARVVADALIAHGVDPARLVLVAAATNEPVATGAYTPAEREENDLVELLQINKSVGEFGGQGASESTP